MPVMKETPFGPHRRRRQHLGKVLVVAASVAAGSLLSRTFIVPGSSLSLASTPSRHFVIALASVNAASDDVDPHSEQPNYKVLGEVAMRRASDGAEVALPNLWASQEGAVVVFLRHFG
mmetsp:Transcript_13208/g.20914  ORF Transcript_13208/g.20914 Transcript_13208/m.20914 type:complete len:118 (-) Transcript_13208:902-1255(-)